MFRKIILICAVIMSLSHVRPAHAVVFNTPNAKEIWANLQELVSQGGAVSTAFMEEVQHYLVNLVVGIGDMGQYATISSKNDHADRIFNATTFIQEGIRDSVKPPKDRKSGSNQTGTEQANSKSDAEEKKLSAEKKEYLKMLQERYFTTAKDKDETQRKIRANREEAVVDSQLSFYVVSQDVIGRMNYKIQDTEDEPIAGALRSQIIGTSEITVEQIIRRIAELSLLLANGEEEMFKMINALPISKP